MHADWYLLNVKPALQLPSPVFREYSRPRARKCWLGRALQASVQLALRNAGILATLVSQEAHEVVGLRRKRRLVSLMF